MSTYAEILKAPEAFGFHFVSGAVATDGRGDKATQLRADAPVIDVTDVAKFEASFPGVILAHINGQSIRVRCQGITRASILANRSISNDTLKEMLVTSVLLKQRSTRTHTTVKVETRFLILPASGTRVEVTSGVTDEIRAQYAAELTDLGVKANVALEKAKALK